MSSLCTEAQIGSEKFVKNKNFKKDKKKTDKLRQFIVMQFQVKLLH